MSLNIPATTRKRVVVIGGGFGGMKLIDSLRRSGFQLVLIDQNNYHQFQPLLYQVATAGLNPGSIAFPFRRDFRHIPDFHFRMARVTRIVPGKIRSKRRSVASVMTIWSLQQVRLPTTTGCKIYRLMPYR